MPDEDRPGMTDRGEQRVGIRDGELEMLGRDAIADGARFVEVAHLDQRAAVRERRGDDRSARHLPEPGLRLARDRVEHLFVGRHQQRLRKLVVLRLREQVDCDPRRIRRSIGDHEDLRHAGDHVYADGPEHAPFRGRDIRIARAADLVDGRNGLRSVCKRSDRLRTPDREDPRDAREMRGCEHQRIAHAVRRRHDHDDLAHAGDLRRYGIHQHRRRIGRLAAGHVQAHAVDRGDSLAELGAVRLLDAPVRRLLLLVIDADPGGRRGERIALR